MSRTLSTIVLLLGVGVVLPAQQLTTNSTNGSLRSNGANPTVGAPFQLQATDTLAFEVGGGPDRPFSLFHAPGLLPISIPVLTQWADIDLLNGGTFVDGIGINLSPAALPSFFGRLNPSGQSAWTIPLNGGAIGNTFALQGVCLNPVGQGGFTITAACVFDLVPVPPLNTTLVGDDVRAIYNLSAPIFMYGVGYQTIAVSTNGWIHFGDDTTNSDLSESATKFINGTVGGSAGGKPVIAVLWEDVDMGNNPSQAVNIVETGPGILQVDWINAEYFVSTPFGSVFCTIDSNIGIITIDYTGYNAAAPPTEGLVGVSDGGLTGSANVTAWNLAQASAINPFVPANPAETVFQSFDGIGSPNVPAEPFDLGGLQLNFVDLSGTGTWQTF